MVRGDRTSAIVPQSATQLLSPVGTLVAGVFLVLIGLMNLIAVIGIA